MNYTKIKKLPPVEEFIQAFPLSSEGHKKISADRREIKNILEGKDKRLLMIIGPCSAWPNSAVLKYAERLQKVNEKVADHLKIVMRLYIQKPRTRKGWTGPFNQPNPFLTPDIEAGLKYSREMMVNVVEMGLPIADESVFTSNARGFSELVSWFAIGARSTEDQEHRVFASATDCPIGMKNPTHGSIEIAINSIIAAQHPHVATIDQYEVQTHGNPHAHLVLRGSNQSPNYSVEHFEEVKKQMEINEVKNPAVMVDVSHDNCMVNGQKRFELQPKIIFEILRSLKARPELYQYLKGFMVESFLKNGNQKIDLLCPEKVDLNGLSITDPCIGWEQTEKLLYDLVDELQR